MVMMGLELVTFQLQVQHCNQQSKPFICYKYYRAVILLYFTECDCDAYGTLENYECDRFTGDCICKRFVTGQRCDMCIVSFTGDVQLPCIFEEKSFPLFCIISVLFAKNLWNICQKLVCSFVLLTELM